ncbi:BREX protein BrxB domain-containing protein [Azospirillum argentinense]
MSGALFERTPLDVALEALERDLKAEGGPAISAMRNYRFAILAYRPGDELRLRSGIRRLSESLVSDGWDVLSISMQALFMERLRSLGEDAFASIAARERRTWAKSPERALNYLAEQISPVVEGEGGIASEVIARIERFAADKTLNPDRTVVFIGRAGALYPFFRTSSLLKHIDGKTFDLPVVLLYPGVKDNNALSFMGRLTADRDYRPRIYP